MISNRCTLELEDTALASGNITIVVVDYTGNTVREKFSFSISQRQFGNFPDCPSCTKEYNRIYAVCIPLLLGCSV